jgi:hypothetical protein
MLNKTAFIIILSLTFNAILIINSCQPNVTNKTCHDNPISECNDGNRFHSHHVKGKSWAVDRATWVDDSIRYRQTTSSYVPSVFISKNVLNELFRSDNTANGIVCTIGKDASGHLGILIRPDRSDSTDISDSPTAYEKASTPKSLAAQVSPSSDTTTTTSKTYFSRIYCPPQCIKCDTCTTL